MSLTIRNGVPADASALAVDGQLAGYAGFVDVGSHVFMVGSDPQVDRILVRSIGAEPPRDRPR